MGKSPQSIAHRFALLATDRGYVFTTERLERRRLLATTLLYAAPAGVAPDQITLIRSVSQLEIVDGAQVVASQAADQTASVEIDGAAGRDTCLTIDYSNGALDLPIAYNGGHGGFNSLSVQGNTESHESFSASGPHSGLIRLGASTISYTNLSPISDTTAATNFTVTGTSGPDTINIVDGPVVAGFQTTQVNSGSPSTFELVNFANKTNVTIAGGGGNDSFTLNTTLVAAGLGSLNLSTSSGSNSSINVLANSVATTLENLGTAATINVGNQGLTSGIKANVNLIDLSSTSTYRIDDSADTTARTVDLDSGSISGLSPGSFSEDNPPKQMTVLGPKAGSSYTGRFFGWPDITVVGGAGNDTMNMGGTFQNEFASVDGGGGTNSITVPIAGNDGAISVGSNGGLTNLTLDDTSGYSGVIADSSAGGFQNNGRVNYGPVSSLTVDVGGTSPSLEIDATPGPTIINETTAASVTVDGASSNITINGAAANDLVDVSYAGPGTITDGTAITFAGVAGDMLSVSASGTASTLSVVPGDLTFGSLSVKYSGISSLSLSAGTFNVSGDLGAINLSATGSNTVVNLNSGQNLSGLSVANARVNLSANGGDLLSTNSFSLTNGGTFDLANNVMLVHYLSGSDPVATIRSYLAVGYNNGAWNGTPAATTGAITSATAQGNPNHNTAIGYADSADGQGVNTTPNTIELKYTLYGDANLDGQVNSADLQILLASLNRPGSWDQGDFNYDGQVNSADLQSLLFTLNTSLGNQATPLMMQAASGAPQPGSTATAATAPTITSTTPLRTPVIPAAPHPQSTGRRTRKYH
ncbi:MAG TPA: dockerin type I repeat-containing protein [Tepidisphaeraceae bacterium]|nr:dockerin type I repeat-containing protein [Tepidisphaeraceae bacterium]